MGSRAVLIGTLRGGRGGQINQKCSQRTPLIGPFGASRGG